MKKLTLILLAAVLLLHLSGCGMKRAEVPAFTEHKADFSAVAAYARSYYADHGRGIDHVTLLLCDIDKDGRFELKDLTHDTVSEDLSDELAMAIGNICAAGFTDILVEEDYLIFWEDETGRYGLLLTDAPRAAAYDLLGSSGSTAYIRKITSDWYEFDRRGI